MPENRSSAQARRSGRLWALRAVKSVVSLAALVVLGGLAWKVVVVLFENLPDHDAVLSGLSVVVGTVFGVTISLIKRISSALGVLSRWITGDRWSGFLSAFGAFCVTLPLTLFSMVLCVALGLELFTNGSVETPGPDEEMTLEKKMKKAMAEYGYTTERADLLDNLAMLKPPSTDALEDGLRFPIMFEGASELCVGRE